MRACGAAPAEPLSCHLIQIVSACVFCSDFRVLTCGPVLRTARAGPSTTRPPVITHVFYLVLALSRLTPDSHVRDTHPRHHNTSKPGIPHQDNRFHKQPFETQAVSRHIKPAISHVDAGFRKHQLETQMASQHIKASRSPCRRSTPQALDRDTLTWHHGVFAESPLARWIDATKHNAIRLYPCTR